MGFLQNKKILVTGMISPRSIAYGIAAAIKREGGVLAFTYQNENVQERVLKLSRDFESDLVIGCDVASDHEIAELFATLGKRWEGLDGIVHSIAYAPKEQLNGEFLDTVTREGFRIAHEVSSYSFAALAKVAMPLMQGRNAALVTLSYLGAVRSVPHYNVMGLAKASLEANVRYMAQGLGPKGIRVNAISAGPIKTLAAAGIADFNMLLGIHARNAPLRRNTTIEEVGNAAAFLLSDLAAGITGEILYVDGGFSTTALGNPEQ